MRRVILHIGTKKTGSTTLQSFFALNESVLADRGILYPNAGRPASLPVERLGQHALVWAIKGLSRWGSDQRCWDSLREELSVSNAHTALISSEAFSSLDDEQVERVGKCLQNYDVKIVIYFRNYLSYMISSYTEELKRRSLVHEENGRERVRWHGTFRSFIGKNYEMCNYGKLLERWSRVFPSDSICIRIFDRVKGHPRLCHDFLDVLGISPGEFPGDYPEQQNVSPMDETIPAFRVLNWFESKRLGRRVPARVMEELRDSIRRQGRVGRIAAWLASNTLRKEQISGPANRKFLASRVADWNEALLGKWLPEEDIRYLVSGLTSLAQGGVESDRPTRPGPIQERSKI